MCACGDTCACVPRLEDSDAAAWTRWRAHTQDEASGWARGHAAFSSGSSPVDAGFGRVVVCPTSLFYPVPNTASPAPPPLACASFNVDAWCASMRDTTTCAACSSGAGVTEPPLVDTPGSSRDSASHGAPGAATGESGTQGRRTCACAARRLALVREALGAEVCEFVFADSQRTPARDSDAPLLPSPASVHTADPTSSAGARLLRSVAVHYWARSWQRGRGRTPSRVDHAGAAAAASPGTAPQAGSKT